MNSPGLMWWTQGAGTIPFSILICHPWHTASIPWSSTAALALISHLHPKQQKSKKDIKAITPPCKGKMERLCTLLLLILLSGTWSHDYTHQVGRPPNMLCSGYPAKLRVAFIKGRRNPLMLKELSLPQIFCPRLIQGQGTQKTA